ncbi:hypothetical protein CUT44_08990 [Streptomyces carminius]|uniref:Uncharacterized protein n=1 Tax=Streptomyces carminius TaxID=2665496 RepID=A0A2M8M0V0_9ACTN|nr:hypothetical protein [Streptomyces carminius]PJE97838.1 hypothetical protein CUT44_08990 [Streptomyces carminius]
MPLRVHPAPAPALRSVHAALGSLTGPGGALSRSGPSAGTGAVRPELPLPLHVLRGITSSSGPPATRLAGWRFLLCDTHGPLGAAEAKPTADGWAFSHFCEGPFVASTEKALRLAEALPTTYQPRLLSVPELYMLTLWLHSDTEADAADGTPAPADLLVPLAPAPPGIAAHRPQRVDGLLPLMSRRLVPSPLLGTPA